MTNEKQNSLSDQAEAMARLASCPPSVRRLIDELGYPLLGASELPAFLRAEPAVVTVLFFTEDPQRYPESDDVAVVLPELVRHFAGRLRPAVVARQDERALQALYGFQKWPALVFLRGEDYLGAITGIQDWHVYLERIEALLRADPKRPPVAVGIPVVGDGSSSVAS